VRGGLTFNFDKNSTTLWCFIFQFGAAWSFFGGAKPTKAPLSDGSGYTVYKLIIYRFTIHTISSLSSKLTAHGFKMISRQWIYLIA